MTYYPWDGLRVLKTGDGAGSLVALSTVEP